MNKCIICIDIKSFFASVECIERNIDPFKVALVVADTKRGNGAMTLAISPYLKSLGVESRTRVFTLPKNIDIIYAKPRMKLYEHYSNKVIEIYKSFVDEKDMHIFSIDEVFLDVTKYLKYYNVNDITLAKTIMNKIKKITGLSTTCGIGPNIFLSKVAMDIEAKSSKDFIAKWTYKDVESKLHKIEPLSKICGIGKNYEKHLNDLKIYKLEDIFKYNRMFYIKRFGNTIGNDIWMKANGLDFNTIEDLNKKNKEKSMSLSQILYRDYNKDEAFTIIIEMVDMLCHKLRKSNKLTGNITLFIKYSRDINKGFKVSERIDICDSENIIIKYMKKLYLNNIEDLPIRQIGIVFSNLIINTNTQLSLFENNIKNTNYNKAIDNIHNKFGPTSILRASSLLNHSTIKEREKFKNLID